MKRIALVMGLMFCFASPSFATSDFAKKWKAEYLGESASPEFVKAGRKAGCYVCHVKGHPDKKEARNEYGKAVHKFLDKKDFPKDYVKANPEEAMAKILAGLKKANELKSKDGKTFGEKIKANELPAVDMEYEN